MQSGPKISDLQNNPIQIERSSVDKDEKEEIWDAIYKEYLEETKEKSETTDATEKADATEKTETTATPEELENSDASTVVNTATADVINLVNEAEQKLLGRFRDTFYKATINTYVDPIVIDLNGDGVFTTSLEQGTHFDFNGDGFAEKTAWTSFGDGLLVRDVNGNGTIDNGTELFGDQTILKNGSIATSGYEALADVNDNQDDVIDSKDSSYQELNVWMYFNQDGKSKKW